MRTDIKLCIDKLCNVLCILVLRKNEILNLDGMEKELELTNWTHQLHMQPMYQKAQKQTHSLNVLSGPMISDATCQERQR